MATDILPIAAILVLIDDHVWLATDDGDEMCSDCAQDNIDSITEASNEQLHNGWGVTSGCVGGSMTCCLCNEHVCGSDGCEEHPEGQQFGDEDEAPR